MPAVETINKIIKRYNKISLWIIVCSALIVLLVMNIMRDTSTLDGLITTMVYFIITCGIYGMAWKEIANSSPNKLTMFYLAASTIRLFTAILTALIYCLIVKKHSKIQIFIIIFVVYYIAILIFDSIYFSRAEKMKQ